MKNRQGQELPVASGRRRVTLKYVIKPSTRSLKPAPNLSFKPKRRPADQALKDVTRFLQPGDVINESGLAPWWQLWWRIPFAAIRSNQKRIFGRQSIWHDTHCMLYLDPGHTLSVQPMRAKWLTPADYCLHRISIWRFTKYPMPLTPREIKVMRDYADEHLIDTLYDVGQLLDILVNTILGYPNVIRYPIFDFGKKLEVCSVGVRTLFEQLRKVLNQNGQPSFDNLFRKLNPMAPWPGGVFPQSRIPNQYGVDVEATAPAHFANSHYFDNEFKLVAVFDQGWPVYPLP
jgi:hypothetical protein